MKKRVPLSLHLRMKLGILPAIMLFVFTSLGAQDLTLHQDGYFEIPGLMVASSGVAGSSGNAQTDWPGGCRAAVVLTYDDGWDNHIDVVARQLDSVGLKGTFFVPGHSGFLYERMEDWRRLAASGHELGNHTLFHPCDWAAVGLSTPYGLGDLNTYSYVQLKEELRVANTLLKAIDGRTGRTFAYTCGQFNVEGTDFSDSIRDLFLAARGAGAIPDRMERFNLFNTPSWCVPENTRAAALIGYVEEAREKGTIAIFMFHGVGGLAGRGWFNVEASDHMELLRYIASQPETYYCATFLEVMEYIRDHPEIIH
jgi:sialate O-acetylesterase